MFLFNNNNSNKMGRSQGQTRWPREVGKGQGGGDRLPLCQDLLCHLGNQINFPKLLRWRGAEDARCPCQVTVRNT